MKTIHLIAAARPNFMKIAPLFHALEEAPWAQPVLVHTGQHYDRNLSADILEDLRLPSPDCNLEIGSGSHATQTAGVMIAYEKVCMAARPDWVVVPGDVNSTMACALVGAKLQIPVVHLEAGLRSRDRRMPEEINRLVADVVADVLWTPSEDADENLLAEGVSPEKIDRIGNIMIDSLQMLRTQIEAADTCRALGLGGRPFALVTLHRPSNVDQPETLEPLVDALVRASKMLPIVFIAHPRTSSRLEEFGLRSRLEAADNIRLLAALPYLAFMNLLSATTAVITDSGGLQEETTFLGIPCLTLRENTERPITVKHGTNELVCAESLLEKMRVILDGRWKKGRQIPLWDGKTAERAVAALKRRSGL